MSDSEARQAESNARQEAAQATPGQEGTSSGWTPAPPSESVQAEGSVSAPDAPDAIEATDEEGITDSSGSQDPTEVVPPDPGYSTGTSDHPSVTSSSPDDRSDPDDTP